MSDTPVSREDFDKLATSVQALADAQTELARAKPADKPEARAEVNDADREARAAAKRLGLSDSDIDTALRSKRKSELRELLDEIEAEKQTAATDDPDDDDKDNGAATVTNLRDAADQRQAGKRVRAPKPPEPDDAPGEGAGDQGAKSWAGRIFGS